MTTDERIAEALELIASIMLAQHQKQTKGENNA
jgi:hypothetical protein